jgi:catechol 2,3-dioxygenase-like lactoylglutathione lyase family enzyme
VDAADARVVPAARVITGLAHTALCVADVDEAVAWYRDVLGLIVLSPPYRVEGPDITRDMGELVPAPVVVKAAIVGVADDSDRVIEVIEYPNAPGRDRPPDASVVDHGFTHVALLCDDVVATRADLEAKGVRFLVEGVAEVAGVRTTWLADPWDNVFILVEKVRRPERPYYRQF